MKAKKKTAKAGSNRSAGKTSRKSSSPRGGTSALLSTTAKAGPETQQAVEVQDFGEGVDAAWAERICQEIETSSSGLDRICDVSKGFPCSRQFHRWLNKSLSLSQRYARAKERQAERLAYEALQIADTPRLGIKTKTGTKGVEVSEGDMIEHRRLQYDARRWLAGKLDPKKWGDKLDLTSDNKPLPAPIIQVMPPSGEEGA